MPEPTGAVQQGLDRSRSSARIPRYLHPGAWWLWAIGLAVAASQTTNPALLMLILVVVGFVVQARRPDAPWARSFGFFLKLAALVVVIRVLFQVVLGEPIGNLVMINLPSVKLPDWLAALRLGGPFTVESLVFAFCNGLRLAVLLACFGAANSLASAARLLKAMPPALYEIGVAVVVAMTFAPQLVSDLTRIRTARRLRGRPTRGLRGLAGSAAPVFDGALDRAVSLAATMDARGYGRSARVSVRSRRLNAILTLGGMVGVCLGVFGVMQNQWAPGFSLMLLVVGLLAAMAGLWLGGKRAVRTRYRPDPWRTPEWAVAGSGLAAGCLVIWGAWSQPEAMAIVVTPLSWPALPLIPTLGILLALIPAVVAPSPPVIGSSSPSSEPTSPVLPKAGPQ
ncbi:MAG: energy-coupling factor transporter transmembrane component T [Candidatus Nanopelagicales bacterium]|nr:energy-coupling factor transporter transmembrane component T [Candidatus Nanopelagicales bacterium]